MRSIVHETLLRSKDQRSTSQGHATQWPQNIEYIEQTSLGSGNAPVLQEMEVTGANGGVRCLCACEVKICPKLAYGVVKSPQFQSVYNKSWSLNAMFRAVFRPEAELTLLLRMCTKEIVKTLRKCIPTEELFPCYRKIGVAEANGEVRFMTRSS